MRSLCGFRFFFMVVVSALLGGCGVFGAVERGYGNAFALVESAPLEAKQVRKLSMQELAVAPRGWREYEMGRRYEKGIGVVRNLDCAAYWYRLASISPYEQIDFNPMWGVNSPTVTRMGLPWARVAQRRIGRTNVAIAVDPRTCQERG